MSATEHVHIQNPHPTLPAGLSGRCVADLNHLEWMGWEALAMARFGCRTRARMRLLRVLVQNAGKPLTRLELADLIGRGVEGLEQSSPACVSIYLHHVRQMLIEVGFIDALPARRHGGTHLPARWSIGQAAAEEILRFVLTGEAPA